MQRHLAALCTLVLVSAPLTHAVAAEPDSKPPSVRAGTLTPEMVVGTRGVGDVAISPDGKLIAYVVGVPRGAGDEPGTVFQEIWIVASRGGNPRRYTANGERAWAPAFSPDGKSLAFLSTRPQVAGRDGSKSDRVEGLYVLPVEGGEARLVTPSKVEVQAFRWRPDGRAIAYTAKDSKTAAEVEDEKAGRDQVVVDANLKPSRLWTVDVASGACTRLTEGDAHVVDFDWAPDGTRLVLRVTETPRIDENYVYSALVMVPASGGFPAPFVPTRGKLLRPVFSPSGGYVAWLGATDLNDPFAGSVFVAATNGGAPQEISRGQGGCATAIDWLDDQTLVVARTLGTATVLELQPRQGGQSKTVASGGPVFTDFALAPAARQVALAASTPQCPNEVYAVAVRGKAKLQRLTTTNPDLERIQLGNQQVRRWKAADGLEIEGILVQPLGFVDGRKYPLVVLVHGGPESCHRNGWVTSYSTATQLWASRGCVVLLPNYRGSIGRDEAYERADHGDLMGSEFADILAGIDDLVARGWVDSERVGIAGGSYGGYTTAWAATAHSERFAAGVDLAGITDWLSMQGTSDIPEENALVHWNRPFYANMDLYWERSPLAHVNDCRTPLLILHGERDARVPIGQGEEMYTALRLLGRDVAFVSYPREAHGLRESAHQLDALQRTLAWFDRYLQLAPGGITSRR
jgi:dipeptidyl aminopeptidase/acylaminoacyl peptidase